MQIKKPVRAVPAIEEVPARLRVNAANPVIREKYSTPPQIAERSGFGPDFIRKLFRNEPGVTMVKHPETMHRRKYSTMKIPDSVADRVLKRLQNK